MKRLIQIIKANAKIIALSAIIIILILLAFGINYTDVGRSVGADKSATEIKLGEILSLIDGVGDTDVLIYESEGEVSGVMIVCSGGDNIIVRNNILNAVSTALNIDKKIIAIYAMGN